MPQARRLEVIVADDSLLVREGVRRVLEAEPDIVVRAESGDLDSTLAAVERHPRAVLLTDIRMPPSYRDEGIAIAHELRRTHPDLGVIVLSQYLEPSYALALFAEGHNSRGYLLKERLSDGRQLVDAVRTVAAGGAFVDPLVVDTLLRTHRLGSTSAVVGLTPREQDVLAAVATGLSNAAISRKLAVTQRAVERHISSIFAKLGLANEGRLNRRVAATLAFLAEHDEANGVRSEAPR
jgi:DNA-binding NarL/FixJ family response regulator